MNYSARLKEEVRKLLDNESSPAQFVEAFYLFVDEMPDGLSRSLIDLIDNFNEELAYYQPDNEVRARQSGLYDEKQLRQNVERLSSRFVSIAD